MPVEAPPRSHIAETKVPVRERNPNQENPLDALPMAKAAREFGKVVTMHDRIILDAQTGSGKTIVAPVLVYETIIQDDPDARIIVTQPRRIAARSNATFVSEQLGKNLVGYRYKGEDTTTPDTRITFTVDDSLLNELQKDPLLRKYRVVFADEAHDMTARKYVQFALLKKAQDERKRLGLKPLKIVFASATLDKQKFLDYFPGAIPFPVEGRSFPVDPYYSTHEIEQEDLPSEAAKKAMELIPKLKETDKILIFMKGKTEIDETIKELGQRLKEQFKDEDIDLISLMGGEQVAQDQDKIYLKKKQIIVATNVAEASITVPGVTVVIDSGLMNVMVYDKETGLTSLQTLPHTKSNMTQRAGRAGRIEAGEAHYLFTKGQAEARPESMDPEILTTDLTEIVLKLKSIGVDDISSFDFMDKPSEQSIAAAIDTLQKLGALDAHGAITEIGKQMEELPVDPHFARMLIEAKQRDCVEAVSILVGFLSERRGVFAYNPRTEDFEKKYAAYIDKDSDFLTLLNVWNAYLENGGTRQGRSWAQKPEQGLSPSVLYNVATAKNELLQDDFFGGQRTGRNQPIDIAAQREAIEACVAAGFMDRLLVKSGNTYGLANGKRDGITIDRSSALAHEHPARIVSGVIRVREGRAVAGINQKVTEELIHEVAPYLKEMEVLKKELERQRRAAVAEAVRITEVKHEQPVHHAQTQHHEQPAAKKEETFIEKIKQVFTDIVARIKKLLRIK